MPDPPRRLSAESRESRAFPGGIEVVIGDVAAGATVVTAPQKFMFSAEDLPATKHVPVTVTLKYTSGEAAVEVSAHLILNRAE